MDIEEIAEKIARAHPHVPDRHRRIAPPLPAEQIAQFMGWQGEAAKQGKKAVAALAKAFIASERIDAGDQSPCRDTDRRHSSRSTLMSIDDNALFRQQEIAAFYDAHRYRATKRAPRI